VIEMASIMIGVAGVAQQLKTANATVAAPSNLRITDFDPSSGSGNTDAVDIAEDEPITSPFAHDGSSFSNGAYQVNVNLGSLDTAYTGSATSATLEFGGFLDTTAAGGMPAGTTFAWDVIIGENNSLSNGNSASIIGTASTAQNSLTIGTGSTNNGVGKQARLTFGGSKAGVNYPAANDVFHINVSCTATSAGGSASASVNIEYTFVL
tara:strand:+ start:169 stop:792 length:624 start_codon:yes stop_codon:yes gene_type:complete